MAADTAEVIAISSGKGGVGKTTLTVNLGIALAKQGKRVCLFDADTNLANINILLRKTPRYTLQQVLSGEKNIEDIVISAHGISLVPGASGITDFSGLTSDAQSNLLSAISKLEKSFDVILVDTSAGIHDSVLDFIQKAHQSIILITPEPTSLTDAFSLLRMLRKRKYRQRINVVVNQPTSELDARKIFKRFSGAVKKYIGYQPAYLGFVNRDSEVSSAVCAQIPVRIYQPNAISSLSFDRLANSLICLSSQQSVDQALTKIWRSQIDVPNINSGDTIDGSKSSPVIVATVKNNLQHKLTENKVATPAVTAEKYIQDNIKQKEYVLDEHKLAILESIDDANVDKQKISLMLDRFINAYYKRFKDYPSDLPEQVNDLLKINALPQPQINQLLSALMLFYKDNRQRVDRDFTAEFLNQQIGDYVNEFGKYPFDPSQTLMQAVGLGQISNEAILELDTILKLVGESNIKVEVASSQQVYATDIEEDRSDLAEELKDQIEVTPSDSPHQSLLTSIHFASQVTE